MRFTSVWTTATTDPTTSVSAARTKTAGPQSSARDGNAVTKTLTNATSAATFPAEAINAVTGVGEP